jgi:thiamine biosynthesis lipoprotein
MPVTLLGIPAGIVASLAAGGCGTIRHDSPRQVAVAPAAVPTARPPHTFLRATMGGSGRITICTEDADAARAAAAAAFDRLDEIEQSLSDYREDSEVVRLASMPGTWHRTSDILAAAIEVSRLVGEASGGRFDVTVGPLSRLWREARRRGTPPDESEIAAVRQRVGWALLEMRQERGAMEIRFAVPGMSLDFGGIGKGFGADEALAVLAARGCPAAIVDLGGDIAIGAPPQGRRGWRIAIARPGGEPEILELAECGIATSGDREQHLAVGGDRYSHLLDPRSGVAANHAPTATAVARTAAIADGLATAISLLDEADAARLVERLDAWAVVESAEREIWRSGHPPPPSQTQNPMLSPR